MANNPEVSVVMSCYNASKWLHEAIDSVLGQTFSNFEFILVDDGSSDETWDIIQSYRSKDRRIVAISKQNTGLADSLNVGIALAKGSWIARLDADDLCEQTRLEMQINFVRNYPEVVLLGSGFVEIDEIGRILKNHKYPVGHTCLVRNLEYLRGFFPHSSAFYRVDLAKAVGGYNKRIVLAEDWRLWLELSLRGCIACLPQSLVKIRKHSGQISHEGNGRRQIVDAMAATVCHFLRKAGVADPSTVENPDEWKMFYLWVENQIDEASIFEKKRVWIDARTKYYSSSNKLIRIFSFVLHLLQSRHFFFVIHEKLFGSHLPVRLSRKWIKHSNLSPL